MNAPFRDCPVSAPATLAAPAQSPEVAEALEAAISAVARLQRTYGDDPDAFAIWVMVEALKKRRAPETISRLEAERLQRARVEE